MTYISTTALSMPATSKSNLIRKKRDKIFETTLRFLRESIDEYEQSTEPQTALLSAYQFHLQDGWERFKLFQCDLDDIDDEDRAREKEALKNCFVLDARIRTLMDKNRSSTTPIPSHDTRGSLRDTRNVSPKCNLTTTTLASSVFQQPNSMVPNASNQKT
jgi:hypothetical protein